jgi:hypothetical protein
MNSFRSEPIYRRSLKRNKVKPQLVASFDLSTMPTFSSNYGPISICSRNEIIIPVDSASQCIKVVTASLFSLMDHDLIWVLTNNIEF